MTLAADIGYVHATVSVAGAYAGHGQAVPLGTGQVRFATCSGGS